MSSGSRAFKLDGPVRAANWGTFEHEKPKEASQFFAKCVMTEGESKKSFSIGDVVECVSLPPKVSADPIRAYPSRPEPRVASSSSGSH